MGVMNTVALHGNKSHENTMTVFQKGGPLVLSLAQLDQQALRLAMTLQSMGLRRGDRIGVIAKNSMEWVLLDLASVKAGFVTAGFEFGRFKCSAELIAKYDLKACYTDAPLDQPGVRDLGAVVRAIMNDMTYCDEVAQADVMQYAPTDITTIKFTSGSTGEPKGLCATVGSIDSSMASVQSMFQHRHGDNLLVFLPLSLLQQRYWIYSALVYGHDITVASYELAFEAAKQTQPSVVMGVPGFYDAIKKRIETTVPLACHDVTLRRQEITGMLGSQVRYLWTGSAPASNDMLRFFNDCGIAMFEGYGMNETCIVTKNAPGAQRLGSVGKVLSNKRVRIDSDGVLIVGSDYPVNTQYAYCAAGDNERIFLPNGEVRTGDLARFDDDGYLYILGRADDVVVLGNGKNVHTRKLEEKLKDHAAIDECVLFGAGRPFLVAVISPALVPADEASIFAHIKKINEKLQTDERIGKVMIAPERFTVEGGLLTSQYKPKRKDIYRVFEADIDRLYGVYA